MPEFTTHLPGTFCWPELATTDQKAAVSFYCALFGWDVNEQPIGPSEMYSMFQLRGMPIAAGYTLRPEQRQEGVPSHWGSYISVASADEAARRAAELGGKVLAPAFDVMDVGRMAVLQDPLGAVFCVWQPKRHTGAAILREPGALCWTELATTDMRASEQFYTSLFGWSAKHGTGGMEYTEFSVHGTPDAGMMAIKPQMGNMPPHWMPYFEVADCDASAAKASSLGAQIYVPPTDIPNVGRFAVVADPQGAAFAVIKMLRA